MIGKGRLRTFMRMVVTATMVATFGQRVWAAPQRDDAAARMPKREAPILPSKSGAPVSSRVLIKFKPTVPEMKREEAFLRHRLKRAAKLGRIGVEAATVSTDELAEEAVNRLQAKEGGDVEFVEVDELVPPAAIPNDPLHPSQWHHVHINAPPAWDTADGQSVVIAIADTGVEATHPDLSGQLVPGWNVVSNSSDTSPVHWHGTSVAGTAAAIGNNGVQVTGAAWHAPVMPMRITDRSDGYAYWSDLANAITYAADHGAKILNASYAAGCSATVQSAANYMRSKGGLVTLAAGNDGTQIACANSPDVIVVSATDGGDVKTSWSNYGDAVDVAAPGDGILTTYVGGSTASVAGTSFAAPLTAGVLALIWSAKPLLSPDQVQQVLLNSAKDVGDPGKDPWYGWGLSDAGKAVALARSLGQDTTPPSAPTSLTATVIGGPQVSLTWIAATDNVGVSSYTVSRDGTAIGTTSSTNYTDSTVTSGVSYTYTVKASDAAGNVSAASNAAAVTIPATLQFATTPYVSAKTGTTATIAWTTSVPSTGYVKYGLSANNLSSRSATTALGTQQTVRLSALSRNVVYYYQVVATDGGTTLTSAVSTFRTLKR